MNAETIIKIINFLKRFPLVKRLISKSPKFWRNVRNIAGILLLLATTITYLPNYGIKIPENILAYAQDLIKISLAIGITSVFTIKDKPEEKTQESKEVSN